MTTATSIQTGKRYRRAIVALFAVGIVSFLVGEYVGQSFAGLVVYAVTVLTGTAMCLYVQFGSSVPLQDERERGIERRASNVTIYLLAYLGLPAFITLFLLEEVGRYSMGPTVETLLSGFAVLYLTWGAVYLLLRYRS